MKPVLTLVAGLPASGKTWFARAWAEKSGASHLNSDAIRTEMGLRGQYDPLSKQRIYDEMLRRTRELLLQGRSVVADSTFYKQSLREPWVRLAAELGVTLRWVELRVSAETARQRLQIPRPDSEATWEAWQQLHRDWQSIDTPHLMLDSEKQHLDTMLAIAEQYWTP